MVPAFFVNLHACGGGLSAIQFETAGSAQTMLSATPSRGMSLMVAGGVSLCELRPEDGRFVQRRHTPNSRPHAVSGSAQKQTHFLADIRQNHAGGYGSSRNINRARSTAAAAKLATATVAQH